MREDETIEWFKMSPKELKIFIYGIVSGATVTLGFVAIAWMISILIQP